MLEVLLGRRVPSAQLYVILSQKVFTIIACTFHIPAGD